MSPPSHAIAIVGLACRFPGAADPEQFWDNLRNGVESIRRFSRDELLAAGLAPALVDHPAFVSAHGALDDIAAFDAGFFGYTSAEAALIDPQHRLLLECAWATLEDAGIDPAAELTGTFAGCGLPGYLLRHVHPALDADDPGAAYQAILGNDKDFLASRIAYKLGLEGPALTIQAACATGLVCVHNACQSLLNGECDAALAGGVSLRIPQASGYLYQAGGIHSADGHCRAFDAEADGTVGGSGVGVVVLKRLADAQAAGDTIHALILGSAVSNDGARKLSFTAPGVDGQARVIAEAQAVAGVAPDSIAYVEAHGTGTALGDPIEIAALSQAFGPAADGQRCLIGSVKTNIGHLDAAAGIAGLIKTVLALRHAQIPPSLHYRHGNPNIDFARSRFQVCAALTPWPASGEPRRAGVSSFGLGGCNAHLVLEQAPAETPRVLRETARLYPISARTGAALQRSATRLADHLAAHPETWADDLAWTLIHGRKTFSHAGYAVAASPAELARTLREGPWRQGVRPAAVPRIAFLYPGQGAQQVGAGRQLYASEAVFREALDACAVALCSAGAADVRDFLLQAPAPALEEQLRHTVHAQPVLFALGYALTALWRHYGIEPQAVLGHSSGEYAAAVTAGLLSLDDAARALTARARLMGEMPPGGMSAIGLVEGELAGMLPPALSVAAVNGPQLCTVAGDLDALAAFEASLAPRGVLVRRLHTAHAFHTPAVDPLLERFRGALSGITFQAPRLAFYSAVLGTRASDRDAADRELWVSQVRRPVCFAPALQALLADGYSAFVEIGPGKTLATLAGLAPAAENACIVAGLGKDGDERRDLLNGLGQLWLAGATPRWAALFAGDEAPRRISLPTYSFEAERHWLDARAPRVPSAAIPAHETGESSLQFLVPSWQRGAPLPPAKDAGLAGTWLFFAEDDGVCQNIAGRLRQAGARLTLAFRGTLLDRADGQWRIDAQRDEDYAALLAHTAPQRILYAWRDEDGPGGDVPPGLAGLFRLMRGVARQSVPLREIAVLSRGACDVTGNETLHPGQAALLGAARVIPVEFPEIACRLIDLDGNTDPARVTAELARAGTSQVALRGPHRWTFALTPALLDSGASPLRRDGIYLLTGGLGGLALTIAERLATEAPVRLALLSRSTLPPAAEWENWLASHPADDTSASRAIRALQDIAARGATLRVIQADCADPAQMAAALAEIRRDWGEPNGVIHAAGVPGGGAMALRADVDIAAVLRPKTSGTQALLAALTGIELDSLVLFSSINTLMPVAGQADYAAANAYLECEAARLRRQGIRATAIGWDAWRDVGMAAHASLPETLRAARRTELENFGLPSGAACDAFLRLAGSEFGQVAVTTARRLADLGATPASAPETDAATLTPPPTDDSASVSDALAEIWKALLGVSTVAPADDFFRLGGHSLLATRVGFRVRQRWGCAVSIEEIFTHPTLAALAALIESRIGGGGERETLLL